MTTVVSTPADAFMITGGTVRDLPATARQEVASIIKLNVLPVARHAKDPEYRFSVTGIETVGDLKEEVLEVVVNGSKLPI